MVHVGLEKALNAKSIHDVKAKTKKQFIISKLVDFCKRTDLHGWKYIVMEDFHAVERGCWAFAVLISVILAASFVVLAYKWYARNPIITVIESTQGAIWDVPFPAVTICDLNIVSRRAARNFSDSLNLPNNITTEFVFNTLKLIPLLFSTLPSKQEHRASLEQLQTVLDFNNQTVDDLFNKVSPATPCTNLVKRCMWKNTIYPCEELFTPVFTLLGQCCTFNYYAVGDTKSNNTSHGPEPRRVASCGYQTALTVLLNTDREDYYSSTIASQGALVIIESAFNIPDLDSPVRMVNPSTEVLIALSPERTYATDGIKNFAPTQRQCYYSNERPLGGFRQYSFHNCMAYEKVQLLLKMCNCVPLYFPMKEEYRKCHFMDLGCIDESFRKTESYNKSFDYNWIAGECLPECEHYDYPLEVALGKLADQNYVNNLPIFRDVVTKNHSLVNVFFNDLVSTRYRRDVYLNWQNILAAFGGLLSLMLGFTLIAGFDVVVFFTLRVVYDYYKLWRKGDCRRNKVTVQNFHKTNAWMEKTTPYVSTLGHDQGNDKNYSRRRIY